MKNLLKKLVISTAITLVASTTAIAQTLVIKSQKIVTNTSTGQVENGVMVIKDGVITSIDNNRDAIGDKVIEGKTLWVTPGIFAPYTTLGLVEVGAERTSNNVNAADTEATVRIRAADSFNPKSVAIAENRIGGITFAAVAPDARTDIFGGQGMIVTTSGEFDSTLNASAFIFIDYSGGSELTGGSKGAAMAFLRDALADAANYNSRYKSPTDGDALHRADAQALRMVLSGFRPLLIAADQAVDMLNIIELKKSYPRLNIIIVGAVEGWMVAEQLANADIGVIVDPLENLPASFDLIGARLDNAKLLLEAGVNTAFMTRSATGGTAHNLRLAPQHAGNAVAAGLSWEQAFKAVTLTPATMFGYQHLGELEAGQKANLVIWNGDPLEITSAVVAVIIDGKTQSMESRQTKLRDRYNPTNTDDKVYGYR
jgi:imidazolonepropionase-like amidohydrolase